MKKINLKVANFAHARFLFNLYNSSIAKGFSITKKKINFKDHLKWLKTKIDNEFSKIYIGYINLRKIGYVRFEQVSKKKYNVSIANHVNFIGKGLGPVLLNLSIKKFLSYNNSITIFALVKKDNIASKKTFIKNNFKLKKKIPKRLMIKNSRNLLCFELKSNNFKLF